MSENNKETISLFGYIGRLLREFCLVIVLQTVLFTLFWNMTVVGVFNTQDYTINILTGLYAILTFKVFTFSYVQLLIRSNTAMIQAYVSTEVEYRKAKDAMLASYMLDAMTKSEDKSDTQINS